MFDFPIEKKRYYSISEIGKMFGVSNSLIRFWESEFNILTPSKNTRGERRFTQKDIEALRIIYHLVKDKGFTLEGAKKEIKANKARLAEKFEYMEKLSKIRRFLKETQAELRVD